MTALRAFLMTDLVGSTRAMQADPRRLRALIEEHDEALLGAIAAADGRTFKHTGDGVCAVFDDPTEATRAAVTAQRALSDLGADVRMAVDVGPAESRGDDFFGLTLNRCARLMALAHGGQILATMAVEELVRRSLPDGIELRDVGVVRLRDFNTDDRIFQVVAPLLRRQFPPPSSVSPGAPVPAARTRLLGRDEELQRLVAAVGAGRLISLVGPGGSGKTRLAIETLVVRKGELGGATFVDLAPLADPALVANALADTLAMPAGGGVPSEDLVRFLAQRRMLVVLDNCEHLAAAAAALCDDVLERCPGIALLTTSREPLRVPGEQVIRLEPLRLGDATDLFVERARQAGGAAIGVRDRPVVEALCRHLDGIPLAIELAAAHAAHLPLGELAELINRSLGVLVDDRRGTAERHRTLDAALAWSYDRLPSAQQRLLRQLAAFSGAFTLRGVECVADLDTVTAARQVGALVDASLVVLDAWSSTYRLLETVRSFAGERLADAGETDAAFDRLHRRMLRNAPGPWTCWLNLSPAADASFAVANLRGVLSWCAARERPQDAAVLVAADLSPWFMTSRAAEAIVWLNSADEERLSPDERIALPTALTWLAFTTLDLERVRQLDDLMRATPAGHAALLPLRFLAAWRLNRSDLDAFLAAMDIPRSTPGADESWQQHCDLIEAMALLLAGRPADAVRILSWARNIIDSHNRNNIAALALAQHLNGNHAEVTRLVRELDEIPATTTFTFSDLIGGLVTVAEAVGRHDLHAACTTLGHLLDTTDHEYPHLVTAWGFGVQAAAVVAYFADRPSDAVTLLAASRHHRLHYRYEAAEALGRAYDELAKAELGYEATADAQHRGRAMSISDLIALARTVAGDDDSSMPASP